MLEISYQALSTRREGLKDTRVFEMAQRQVREARTTWWRPACECGTEVSPAIVLDPFAEAPRFTATCASCYLTFGDARWEVRGVYRLLVDDADDAVQSGLLGVPIAPVTTLPRLACRIPLRRSQ